MSRTSDVERVLRDYFADDGGPAPDYVLDIVADRISLQPRRRSWRLLRRLPMNPLIKLGAAAAAVLVIAVVGWNLSPGGGPGPGSPSPTPTASSTATGTPTQAWDTPGIRCGRDGCGGPQAPGSYSSRALSPALSYTLASSWVNVDDWPGFFMLYPDTPTNRAVAAAAGYPPYILVLPGPLSVSPSRGCAESEPTDLTEVDAVGFVEFLSSQPGLTISAAVPITIDGLPGQQVDASVTADWTGCLPQTPLEEKALPTDSYRFILLDAPNGDTLMIRLRAPSDFEAFLTEAMPVVESFDFDIGPVGT